MAQLVKITVEFELDPDDYKTACDDNLYLDEVVVDAIGLKIITPDGVMDGDQINIQHARRA